MAKITVPSQGWVVVCDASKALVLRNAGDERRIALESVEVQTQSLSSTQELGTDRPGRVHQPFGTARSAVEEKDRHSAEEEAFLGDLARRLDTAVSRQAVKHLVLVAPPRALGWLRQHLGADTLRAVRAEVHKDLTHLTVGEIEEHLSL